MLYFIPAWYQAEEWNENEQLWYKRRAKTETDDTVKQIQLFQRNRICDFRILLLSYAPNLRHFLHRQSAFRAPYWSCFDAIQEVQRKKPAVLSFHNLKWPENIEFIYSPFAVVAMLDQQMYAKIEFGEDGNPIRIDMYENGRLKRVNEYDDRGFVSRTTIYEDGNRSYTQYLTEDGVWKICEFADGHVIVNPKSNHYTIKEKIPFEKRQYGSMEEVIEEVLASYLKVTGSEDIFCVAAHQQHMNLLNRTLREKKTIYSFFGERLKIEQNESVKEMASHGNHVVADSKKNLERFKKETSREKNACVITPYDTRVDFGISQQLRVQKILVPVDHLSEDMLEEVIVQLAAYLEKNENARVHLFTRNSEYNREDILLGQVGRLLEKHGYLAAWARKENKNKFEFILDEEDAVPIRFVVEQCVDELSVSKCMREQRVMVDLSETSDLFLQIACVSMGIPQILKNETQYMVPGENGIKNENLEELGSEVAYYLDNLTNWNKAMISSYELGQKHTTKQLIEQWKEVINSVEHS